MPGDPEAASVSSSIVAVDQSPPGSAARVAGVT